MDHVKDSIVGLAAGINGGVATVLVGQPLDTVKVKMQAFPELYSGAWRCFRTTLLKDGVIHGLYAGTVPALVANVAENAILFCTRPFCQHVVRTLYGIERNGSLNAFQQATAGAFAGIWSSLVLCPTELVKCKVQAMREMSDLGQIKVTSASEIGPWAVSKSIYRQHGLGGFFLGLKPTFIREIPGYFAFFGAYEGCRDLFARYLNCPKDDLNPGIVAFCGGLGGAALWTAIFPFDVVKSRMQIGHLEASVSPEGSSPSAKVQVTPAKDQKLTQLILRIYRDEGITAFYRGLGPTLVRTIPSTGVLFVAVEWTAKAGNWLLN